MPSRINDKNARIPNWKLFFIYAKIKEVKLLKYMKKQQKQAIFWDYNTEKMDLNNLSVKIWRLNRQLQFGNLSEIKKEDLKKYLPLLKIDSSFKELLQNYLSKYGKN